jgi:hypothetical protein
MQTSTIKTENDIFRNVLILLGIQAIKSNKGIVPIPILTFKAILSGLLKAYTANCKLLPLKSEKKKLKIVSRSKKAIINKITELTMQYKMVRFIDS